jgi:hypothetical protein
VTSVGLGPAPPHAFALRLDDELALRLRERHHAVELYERIDASASTWRRHVRPGRDLDAGGIAQRMVAAGCSSSGAATVGTPTCAGAASRRLDGLHFLDRPGGSTEVGYWLERAARARG